MRTIVLALFMFPFILSAQPNELFKLLKWNTPKQQQSLIAWYDLQDASTIKANPSKPGQVFSLNDKGIGKNHISQDREMYQPLLTRNEGFTNGTKNGLSFASGGYMVYKFPSEKTVNSITSFVVCKNEIGGSKLLYDLSKEGGEGIASCYSGLYKIESRVPNSLGDFEPNFSNNPGKHLLISTKGSSGNIVIDLNDGLKYLGPGTRNFVGTSYNRIRLSTENGVAPTDGTLYELILFDYELSDKDFQIVKNYLEKKYQIISSISTQNQVVNTNLEAQALNVPLNMFDSQIHVYIDGNNLSKSPKYENGFAKIGRLAKKGEDVISYYRYGYIDNEGRIIISPNNYDLGNFSEGLVSVCNILSNGSYKLGFMDVTGKVVIPLIYQCDTDLQFSDGLCSVIGSNGKYGFINKLGKVVIPFLYGRAGKEGFKNGIARVAKTDFIKDPITINKQGIMVSEQPNNINAAEKFINGTNKTASNVSNGVNRNANSASDKSVVYNFSELKSQGCDVIKSEYKQFAIQYINYRKRVKSNPSSLRIREDTDWENNLRKISGLVTDCAIKLKGGYALEVMGYGEKISSLMPIDPIKPSSSKNNSSVQNKSTSNTSQTKPSQTNNTVEKKVDLSTEVLSQVVSCKTCSNPVTIQKNVPRSPEFKNSFNEIGSITSSMCQKCNKTSLYNYEMKVGRFTRIN